MRLIAKILVGVAALSFLAGVYVGLFQGGEIRGIPAESFARATENLTLIAIALFIWAKHEEKS